MDIGALDICLGDTVHGVAHGPVVMSCGDDQVDLEQPAIFIGRVVMDECSARRFQDANTMSLVILAGVEDVSAEDVGIFA